MMESRRRLSYVSVLAMSIAASFVSSAHASEPVQIAQSIPFRDELLISKAVLDECDLPRKQLEAFTEKAASRGIELVQREGLTSSRSGRVLLVEIVRADSMRQGSKHIKQMAVAGKLFENGEQIGSFVSQRRSGGGMFGDMLTSCAVLQKCVKGVASDVAKWLTNPTQGAQLGTGRHRLPVEP